jgi:adenosylmethionine-8-amino-7-oxononanoate aminotransferase
VRSRYPESPVFYRRLDGEYRRAVAAHGATIEDETGKTYIDAAGGAMVANVGHDIPEIAAAVAEAAALGYVSGMQFTHHMVEELAAELATILPEPLYYSYFLSSGSEAVEAAVKLARQVWVERGRESKWKVISRVPSYHGNTLTALSLSGREHYRKIYGPLLTDFPRIPAPDTYRHPDSDASTGAALEAEILRQGAESVSAFIAEPIIGSSLGAMVPSQAYYDRVRDVCDRHDVLFIADEVLCGMGRTGRWFACQHYDLVPDILVLGKGLNGGVAPLSAVVARRSLVDTLAAGSGKFNHAQTYSHTPVICAAGLATVRYLKREKMVERCAAREREFLGELAKLREFPEVGDVRGKGLLAGIEFVADRASRAPLPRTARFAERFAATAFDHGLIVWPNTGHVDGEAGDIVMLAPPFGISSEEIVEIGRRCRRTLETLSLDEERDSQEIHP